MTYEPQGVCSTRIRLAVADGILVRAGFEDGCAGNSQGLCRLAEGRPVAEVIRRLKGIRCGDKGTSCPDQLARALEKMVAGVASSPKK
ncbi:MAG: TIGR03905 family TSCPD domain-containing protein [Lentisphaeria bacterium]